MKIKLEDTSIGNNNGKFKLGPLLIGIEKIGTGLGTFFIRCRTFME